MKRTAKKCGNSAAVRIPAAVRTRRRYTLEELIAQCDPRKRLSREERAWLDAPPEGRETL